MVKNKYQNPDIKNYVNSYFNDSTLNILIDYSIFVIFTNINSPIINIFIDNIMVIRAKKLSYIKKFKVILAIIFTIVGISPISLYLELKIEIDYQK